MGRSATIFIRGIGWKFRYFDFGGSISIKVVSSQILSARNSMRSGKRGGLGCAEKNESPCKMCRKRGSFWAKMMMFVEITRFLMSCLTFSHGFGMCFVETTSFLCCFTIVRFLVVFLRLIHRFFKRSFDLQSIRTTGNKKLITQTKSGGFAMICLIIAIIIYNCHILSRYSCSPSPEQVRYRACKKSADSAEPQTIGFSSIGWISGMEDDF